MGEGSYRKLDTCRVAVAGAGNVAWHLVHAMAGAGLKIEQVCSRTLQSARELAAVAGAEALAEFNAIDPTVDLCVVCVTDSAVADVARALPPMQGVVVHTSGTVPMDTLMQSAERVGVLYPLQTFSRDRGLDITEVPFFTEASDSITLDFIDNVVRAIGARAIHADSEARALLHVAGVLACNFPNYLLGCARDVLARGGFGLEVLKPLVEETIAKSFQMGPDEAQTGPARRGNVRTIEKHTEMLPPEQASIYARLSEAILKKYHNNE